MNSTPDLHREPEADTVGLLLDERRSGGAFRFVIPVGASTARFFREGWQHAPGIDGDIARFSIRPTRRIGAKGRPS
ncbi:hypothetical protein [Microbacterium sp. Leaf320]|uniref:hypothetical protein n=1 Tax=Microbacterium sp. Leaf320 TaxID=1736334 RepID=UPI0006FE0428|nr:hypothetical protein [Microbacterium sp. Leaf320]KQQ65173.1 hypothetical protein ASF63_14535 [Microbacterium sp. Leaf320]